MKSLTAFSHIVLKDLGDRCHISTSRDSETIAARVEHEGESFLTLTLPAFGKDFQKSLDRGRVADDVFLSFKRHAGLPRFLGGFLQLVFDRETGFLLADPSIHAIFSIHQFCSMFGKVAGMCSDERVSAAWTGFVECEKSVRIADSQRSQTDVEDFNRISALLFRDVFTEVDLAVYDRTLIPKHGPGATAEKLTANGKYRSFEWTERLDSVFPFEEYLFPNLGWYQHFPKVDILEPGAEQPVRVVAVPKTSKTPRIIAIEPTCMQYAQQGLLEALTEGIQGVDYLKNLLGNLDQEPNRILARKGSIDGSLATLDLSEASDRVSNQLVRGMLARWPHLQEAVDACRSRKADVPDHGVIRLAKFASMGSALCFVMEGIVFTTIVFMALERELKRPLTRRDIYSSVGRVRVYGDDIIVPVHMVDRTIELLEAFGLKVNSGKSFWSGSFRESCGGDYYMGQDITPVRVREQFPASRKHTDEIVSTVSLRNLLFDKGGFEGSVRYLDDMLEKLLPVYPEVPRDSPGLGRWSHNPIEWGRLCDRRHTPLIKACVVSHRLPSDPLDGHGALMKMFLRRGIMPHQDARHLQRAGRPVSVDIKTRWIPLF